MCTGLPRRGVGSLGVSGKGHRPSLAGWGGGPFDLVSDGDWSIAQGLQVAYGRQVPHQLRHFHLLQEYRRNIGWAGWEEAKKLLSSLSRREGADNVKRIVDVKGCQVTYWRRKPLNQGLRTWRRARGDTDYIATGVIES